MNANTYDLSYKYSHIHSVNTDAFSLSHKTMRSFNATIESKFIFLLIQYRSAVMTGSSSKPNSFFLNVRAETAGMALSFKKDETTYFPSKSHLIF